MRVAVLPGQLIEVARSAFTQAMEVVVGLRAAIMIAAAVASVVVPRRHPESTSVDS